MRRLIAISIFLLVVGPTAAAAQEPTAVLSTCLADQTNGKDRKDLAKWVFLAMAAHPENKQFLSTGVAQSAEEVNKTAAAVLMRLMTESCAPQIKAAAAQGGTQAVQAAFTTFGQVAMQELMSHPDVTAAMGSLNKYLDQEKLAKVLSGK